jgi:hypothetical protein
MNEGDHWEHRLPRSRRKRPCYPPPSSEVTLDFADAKGSIVGQHYAFHVSDAEFDAILQRVKDARLAFGSGPRSLEDGKLNDWNGGRGFYYKDHDGHVIELMTMPQRAAAWFVPAPVSSMENLHFGKEQLANDITPCRSRRLALSALDVAGSRPRESGGDAARDKDP